MKDLNAFRVLDHYCSLNKDGVYSMMTLDELKTSNEFRIVVGEETHLQAVKSHSSSEDEKVKVVWDKMELTPLNKIGLPETFGDTIPLYCVEEYDGKIVAVMVNITRNIEDAESIES